MPIAPSLGRLLTAHKAQAFEHGHANPSITLSMYAHQFASAEHAANTREQMRDEGPLDPDELALLEERLRGALGVLHGLRLVHSDVREGNVLRVKGEWKLGDLGGVVGFGERIVALQRDLAYRRDGAEFDAPAAPENDLYALAVVLEHAQAPPVRQNT